MRILNLSVLMSLAVFLSNTVVCEEVGSNVAGDINPILAMFPENITFYLSCDSEKMKPGMTLGRSDVRSKSGEHTFEKGLFGKSLRSGRATYFGGTNVDFSVPGTLIVWLAPWKWKKSDVEGYFWPFIARTEKVKIQIGRTRGKWGKTKLYAYITDPKDKNTNLSISGGSAKNWEPGVWHMFAFTWTSDSIGISIDGGKLREKNIPRSLGSKTSWFLIGACKTTKGFQLLQDELVILNKKLTDDELKKAYTETLKLAKKNK